MNYMESALEKVYQANKEAVMRNTWGHLAPTRNKKYNGWMIFCQSFNGEIVVIDYDFDGLDSSPWYYDCMMEFASLETEEDGMIYRFDGFFRNYKFVGTVKEYKPSDIISK